MTATDLGLAKANADRLFRRKTLTAVAWPGLVLLYFAYIFFAFDLPGLAQRANWDNAVTLASDSWSYKTHVTRSNRTGEITYAVEGERKGTYPEGQRPDWVSGDDVVTVDMGGDHVVRLLPDNRVEIALPGYPDIEARIDEA